MHENEWPLNTNEFTVFGFDLIFDLLVQMTNEMHRNTEQLKQFAPIKKPYIYIMTKLWK